MHPQLMLLLELQDLRTQRRALEAGSDIEELEKEHFNIDVDEALAQLDSKIREIEEDLERPVRDRYERVRKGLQRAVVPVINGVCYGCFVSIPTATYKDQDPNDAVRSCQNCGRFIYILG